MTKQLKVDTTTVITINKINGKYLLSTSINGLVQNQKVFTAIKDCINYTKKLVGEKKC